MVTCKTPCKISFRALGFHLLLLRSPTSSFIRRKDNDCRVVKVGVRVSIVSIGVTTTTTTTTTATTERERERGGANMKRQLQRLWKQRLSMMTKNQSNLGYTLPFFSFSAAERSNHLESSEDGSHLSFVFQH